MRPALGALVVITIFLTEAPIVYKVRIHRAAALMSFFGPTHVKNYIQNIDEFIKTCEAYRTTKTFVCMVTDRMSDTGDMDTYVQIGFINDILLIHDERVKVHMESPRMAWHFGSRQVLSQFACVFDVTARMHTTLYDTLQEISSKLEEFDLYNGAAKDMVQDYAVRG